MQEIRREAQLAAQHWSSLVVNKLEDETELISNVTVVDDDLNEPKHEEEVALQVENRFKPKFGPVEVKSRCIQYSYVLITHVIHPSHLYIQIEDQDLPLYRQMMNDLQQEFRWATKQSNSFCSSPVVGTFNFSQILTIKKFFFK